MAVHIKAVRFYLLRAPHASSASVCVLEQPPIFWSTNTRIPKKTKNDNYFNSWFMIHFSPCFLRCSVERVIQLQSEIQIKRINLCQRWSEKKRKRRTENQWETLATPTTQLSFDRIIKQPLHEDAAFPPPLHGSEGKNLTIQTQKIFPF
jgi:hypothetical protein